MIRPFAFAVLVVSAASLASGREVALNGHNFTLPDGMEIEQVAGPGLVERPITASFDEQGRLYVADSSGSNDKVEKQLAEKPHRVVRLEDTDGDGRFDKSIVFADKLMFPEGTLWHDGSLYVAAPPSIWKLTDTDGDGVADRREEWFKGKTLNGCANDLHGPYLGPDGWIYWCKGAFEKQVYERVGKSLRVIEGAPAGSPGDVPIEKTWSTRASHIFRCRPDGSGLEVVMTGGMDNPVDVVFTPGGERIFTTTFLQNPGGGRRDGLIHAIYGGVYGKQHDVVEGHKRTGELMPPLAHLGPAAPCGLAIYESGVIKEYRNNLFACNFNLRKITRHVLAEDGATFKTTDSDFLVSDHLDFHPTDILEDADGSLIVVDTGGWYKLCCPTSQLHKPDVLGAIYRVRQKDPKKIDDPRGLKLNWGDVEAAELVGRLYDLRFTVRNRATEQFGKLGPDVAPIVGHPKLKVSGRNLYFDVGRNKVWTLTRLAGPEARAAVREFLYSPDETVRQAAVRSIGLWRDREALPELLKMCRSVFLHDRRGAAEALGRIGDTSAVRELLASASFGVPASADTPPKGGTPARAPTVDRALEHSIIYALIEIADPPSTRKGLASEDPRIKRVALIALDQMDGGGLDPQLVAGLLSSPEPLLKETAAWIVGRHPEWGAALAGYLKGRLAAKDLSIADRAELEKQLAQFAKSGAVQELLAAAALDKASPLSARRTALTAMRAAGLKELPASWAAAVIAVISEGGETAPQAVAVCRSIPIPKGSAAELAAAILKLAQRGDVSAAARLEALAAVPGGLAAVDGETFDFLRSALAPENPVPQRAAAADVLSKAKLTGPQLMGVTQLLAKAGPLEADRLLATFEQSADEAIGLAVVAVLKESPARAGLRADAVSARLAKYPPSVQKGAFEVAALLNVDLAAQRERLQALVEETKGGDIRRGQAVFMRAKTACNVCHQFGYVGGNIGPDLTRIGGTRAERDLLEAIAFPSASFVRSYEPVTIVTTDGRTLSGLIRKDAADEVILATSVTESIRIPRETIEEIRPSAVSIMPSGLDQQLTVQELADLVAFLKNAK